MSNWHVGHGTTRGALTVFPIWGPFSAAGTLATAPGTVAVQEQGAGAQVGRLSAANTTHLPAVLFQGQIVEGGWQNRMVARSIVVAPGTVAELEVVCVEQGRWSGDGTHREGGRRASGRVRAGLYDVDQQSSVWNRIEEFETRQGPTSTRSYVEHAERSSDTVDRLIRGLAPLPGQIGVLVAISGQPFFAEVFDCHDTLLGHFDSVLRSAAVDAIGRPAITTPSRRARRFLDRAAQVPRKVVGRAGAGRSTSGRSERVELSALEWQGAPLHVVMTNPGHELYTLAA